MADAPTQGEEAVPEFYVDAFNFSASAYTVHLTLSLASPELEQINPVVRIRMSPTHAKTMSILLMRSMKIYEQESGAEIALPPHVLTSHKIDLEQEW